MARFTTSPLTFPGVALRTVLRILFAFINLVAIYNPLGISFAHWVWNTVGTSFSDYAARILGAHDLQSALGPLGPLLVGVAILAILLVGYIFWSNPRKAFRLLIVALVAAGIAELFVTDIMDWKQSPIGVLLVAVVTIALVSYLLLISSKVVRQFILVLIAAAIMALFINNGMDWKQSLVGLLLFAGLGLQVYWVDRALGIIGTSIVVAAACFVVWGLYQQGWFSFHNGFVVQVTVTIVLALLFGLAASVGFWRNWYHSTQTVTSTDDHHDHHGQQSVDTAATSHR